MHKILLLSGFFLSLLCSPSVWAQNTLDGKAVTVPEAEVNRQSAFLDAERERLLGQMDRAEASYRAFVRQNPDHGTAWYGLAKIQMETGNPGDALVSIGKALALESANPWYMEQQAEVLNALGRSDAAADVYDKLIRQHPDKTTYYLQQAYLQTLSGKPLDALKTLDKLEKKAGPVPDVMERKFILYDQLGDTKKAAIALEKMANAYPRRLEYRHKLATYYLDKGDRAGAERVYAEILAIRPDDPSALLFRKSDPTDNNTLSNPQIPLEAKLKTLIPRLEAYQRQPTDALLESLSAAAAALESAHPDDPRAWSFSGDVYYLAERPSEALARYTKCLDLPGTPFSVWQNTLRLLYESGQDKAVMQLADRAMDVWPNRAESHLYYGLAAIRLGQLTDAAQVLQQARVMTAQSEDTALRQAILKALDATRQKN
jgi:tetratricopeptide (TPR) repeat protein